MDVKHLQAQNAIQNARIALRDGDRSAARRFAEQAAQLAPQLEDPWLILAAVASPRASVAFIERALQVNPDSPRARKGMQWALKRLQEIPLDSSGNMPTGQTKPVKAQQAKAIVPPAPVSARSRPDHDGAAQVSASKGPVRSAASQSVATKKSRRVPIFPVLLLVLGCIAVIFAAWTASTSPALASILGGTSQPEQAAHPKVWAQVEIAKPTYTPQADAALAQAEPTQPPPTPTLILPTPEPSATATSEPDPTLPPEPTSTPGSLALEIVEDTPVPTAQATSESAPTSKPNPPVGNGVRWIEVNLSEQRVYAWEGDVLANSFIVSTGTWQTPTVTGTFKIWNKTRIQAMSGPGYYLPDVPFVMYFYEDYGFHGTYWHNNFGTPMSHGCVNLTIPDSEWLYNWASYGTVVQVHH